MKTAITTTYAFNPAAGTLNLSGITGFNIDLLYEVVDLTTNQTIYDAGVQALGYSALSGTTLTLKASMAGLSASDVLQVLYDVPVTGGGGGGGTASTVAVSGGTISTTGTAGAFADGAFVDIGTEADAPWSGISSTASVIAIDKDVATELAGTLKVAGTVVVGNGTINIGGTASALQDGAIVDIGTEADAAWNNSASSATEIAIEKDVAVEVGTLIARTPPLNADGGSPAHVTNFPAPTSTNPVATFQQAITTSAAALPGNSLSNGILLKAASTNTGTVYVGGSAVTATIGYPLKPGDAISFGVANSNQIYVVGTAGDQIYGAGN